MRSAFLLFWLALAVMLPFGGGMAMAAQTPLDRSDPATVVTELPEVPPASVKATPPPPTLQAEAPDNALASTIVGAVRIEGLETLRAADFADVMNAYAGRELAPADLRALASDVANVARRRGYGLATAWIPPQRVVNGILRVQLEEGRIDAIEVSGSGKVAVERSLASLANGRAVRTAALERRLLVAGDVAGVVVGKVRLDRRGARNVLVVATRRDRVRAYAFFDNWGSAAIGPVRAQLGIEFAGLLAHDDSVSVGAVRTPLQPDEFGLVRAAYTKPVGSAGTEIEISGYGAASQAGGVLKPFDIDGRGFGFTTTVSHPVLRKRALSIWTELALDVSDSRQDRSDILIRKDRVTTLSLTGRALAKLGGNQLRGRLTVSRGFDAFGATQAGDPLASRPDADGQFTKIDYWVDFQRPIGSVVTLQLQSEGQLSSGPLLSSQEMGLGGRSFGRGYDYRERSGDSGISGSAEIRFDLGKVAKPIRQAHLYVYADAGTVTNADGGFGGGSLASAGGGLRVTVGKNIFGGVELGIPLRRSALGGSERDARLSFSLASQF